MNKSHAIKDIIHFLSFLVPNSRPFRLRDPIATVIDQMTSSRICNRSKGVIHMAIYTSLTHI
jgi:hypothetical protein